MRYTQDESYYILDTEGEEGAVWLGVKPASIPPRQALPCVKPRPAASPLTRQSTSTASR